MDEQELVAQFVTTHDLTCSPAHRLLDLAAEVGELAADANDTSDCGATPDALDVSRDEVGDVLFALLAFCEGLDIDAEAALKETLVRYESRLNERGDAGSTWLLRQLDLPDVIAVVYSDDVARPRTGRRDHELVGDGDETLATRSLLIVGGNGRLYGDD